MPFQAFSVTTLHLYVFDCLLYCYTSKGAAEPPLQERSSSKLLIGLAFILVLDTQRA